LLIRRGSTLPIDAWRYESAVNSASKPELPIRLREPDNFSTFVSSPLIDFDQEGVGYLWGTSPPDIFLPRNGGLNHIHFLQTWRTCHEM